MPAPSRSLLLCLLALASTFSACKKESTPEAKEEVIDFGPDPGFQYRTPQNLPGGGDATDWIADGAWNSREKQLFAGLNLSLDEPQQTQQTGYWYASVYPNQSEASAGFSYINSVNASKVPAGCRVAYVIVDRRYTELLRGEAAPNATVAFQPNALAAGALYRLYYVCYVPGQRVYFRSHGDIKVE
jgi:hypothetical protein